MTIVIDGTVRVSGVDGTASNPSYEGTDSNTGIFFPAADTIAFTEGGTEVARFDSAGNFGIGTSSPINLLTVQTAATGTTAGSNIIARLQSNASGRDATLQLSDNVANSATISMVGGATVFRQNGVESARIDSSGNVGIGTSSPGSRLHVNAAAGNSGVIAVTASAGNGGFVQLAGNGVTSGTASFDLIHGGDSVAYVYNRSNAAIVFGTNNAERARITDGGQLLIGTTTSSSNYGLRISSNRGIDLLGWGAGRGEAINLRAHNTSNADVMYFNTSAAQVGSISITSSATSYVTSSDYRLKENVAPMTGALAKVAALKPCTYTWKVDGESGEGFIAHELAEVCPNAVSGNKDAVNEDGSIKPQGIDTSFLVATLTAAIQEQQAMIDEMKAEIAALKGNA